MVPRAPLTHLIRENRASLALPPNRIALDSPARVALFQSPPRLWDIREAKSESEMRNTKCETNSNGRNSNDQNKNHGIGPFLQAGTCTQRLRHRHL